jgi:hypothetical protein
LKILFKTLFTIAICGYIGVAICELAAVRWEAANDGRSIEQSIALDPWDAKLRDDLGQYYAFMEQKPELAIASYEAAVKKNPHVADYWLDLGNAYFAVGDIARQDEALKRAMATDPKSPGMTRQVGNAYFMAGNNRAAFEAYKKVLAESPWDFESTLQICWQATHDLDVMSEVLPAKPEAHLTFLKILTDEGRMEEAESMWPKLIGLQKPFEARSAGPFIEYLIQGNEIEAAHNAWLGLGRVDPNFRPYTNTPDGLVVNGGFEQKVTNMGFDWRLGASPHVIAATDAQQVHGGHRSLAVTFDGEAVSDTGLSQLIPVEANTAYTFSGFVKDDLSTARGPQFVVREADSNVTLMRSEELLGLGDWTEIRGEFKTSASTKLVTLRIVREPGVERIKGMLWVDDVSVRRRP